MMDQRLRRQLDRVATRFRRLRLWTALAGVWLLSALLAAVVLGLNWRVGWYFDQSVISLTLTALVLAGACGWLAWGDVMGQMRVRSERVDVETVLHPRGLGDFRVLIVRWQGTSIPPSAS